MSLADNKPVVAAALAGAAAGGALALLASRMCCCTKGAGKAVAELPDESRQIYETNKSNNQYMEFHFTPGKDLYSRKLQNVSEAFDFPIRLGQLFEKHYSTKAGKGKGRAMDLGCATGASVFEMSKHFEEVVGVDLSKAFISTANKMKATGKLEYEGPVQGDITIQRVATIDPTANVDACKFFVGDALNVDPALGTFDAVLAANLLCRVPHPRQLLDSFSNLVNKDGILVLVSPYSWWEGATPVSEWIGGVPGKPSSEEQVKAILSKDFVLIEDHDEPFMIRDHIRRYQLGFSHCTIWRRK